MHVIIKKVVSTLKVLVPVKSLSTHAHNTKSRIFALSNFVSLSMKYHVTAVTPNVSFENTVQNVYHISIPDVYVRVVYKHVRRTPHRAKTDLNKKSGAMHQTFISINIVCLFVTEATH